ncbi:MAG: tetratricopeptide repeat protein [Kouleothrix sp.]|nr:tetratricopeptide repeat protein [Kouleothrix sp.]
MTLRFLHKLSIPSAAYPLVDRADLLDRLDQAITTKQVVALAALAGWGKTTALAQWAARAALPIAWYTLDSADRDPRQFLDYLLHALDGCVPGAAAIAGQLDGTTPQGLPDLFQSTALAVAAAPRPFVLVLDDYHTLEDDTIAVLPGMELIFELLSRIAEYAPSCHLVLASRMLPNLRGIARLTAQRRAMFFDYAVLRWSAAEVQRLAACGGGAISDEGAEQLAARMSGWVTGIVLSLDQARSEGHGPIPDGPPDAAGLAEAGTSEVYAYFAEQIIAPLAPALQRFLEDTSVLDDLSPQRCNMLRGAHDSAAFLAEITRRGLFVSHKGPFLAYHSLFRAFLRARLGHDPVRERELLLRAAQQYCDEDDLDRALDCFLDAGAEDRAIDLLRQAIPRLRQRSRQNTLLACFERLGGYLGRAGRGRILPADLLLAQVRVYEDLSLWERAELALRLAETIGDELVGWEAAILHAEMLMLQGRQAEVRPLLAELAGVALPPRLRLEYHLTIGRMHTLAGEIPAAIAALEAAQALTPGAVASADIPIRLAMIADNLGWAYATQGDRPTALRYLKRADACWQASGNQGRRAMTLNNLGTLALESGQYAEARRALETGLEIARQQGRRREEIYLCLGMGDLELVEGNLDQALACFQEAHVLAERTDVTGSAAAAAAGVLWAAALLGDPDVAQQWQQALAAGWEAGPPDVCGRTALAQALLLQRPGADRSRQAGLAAIAGAAEGALAAVDRAYLALLQATLDFERYGWEQAAPLWRAFEERAAELPEALIRHLVLAHQPIFVAAAASSPLAVRILATTNIPTTIRWQVTTLGSFTCLVDGAPCELSPLHRTILVRLLDAGESGLTVERLWEEVWGDTDIRMAALHKALARIREQTGLAMAARSGHCSIQSPWGAIEYDAQTFERAPAGARSRQELERVIALYRGDFLPGAAPSAALWVDRRRSLLQQRYLDALEQLARQIEGAEPKRAIQHYQHILEIDGCREETAIQLMRLAARQRNHALVSATFDQLEGALRTLGTSPEPATIAILQALGAPAERLRSLT